MVYRIYATYTTSRVINDLFTDLPSQHGSKPKPPTKPRPDGPTPVSNRLQEIASAFVSSFKPKPPTKPRPDGLTPVTNDVQEHGVKPKPSTKTRLDGPTPVSN